MWHDIHHLNIPKDFNSLLINNLSLMHSHDPGRTIGSNKGTWVSSTDLFDDPILEALRAQIRHIIGPCSLTGWGVVVESEGWIGPHHHGSPGVFCVGVYYLTNAVLMLEDIRYDFVPGDLILFSSQALHHVPPQPERRFSVAFDCCLI